MPTKERCRCRHISKVLLKKILESNFLWWGTASEKQKNNRLYIGILFNNSSSDWNNTGAVLLMCKWLIQLTTCFLLWLGSRAHTHRPTKYVQLTRTLTAKSFKRALNTLSHKKSVNMIPTWWNEIPLLHLKWWKIV